jgi:hypothetical protein
VSAIDSEIKRAAKAVGVDLSTLSLQEESTFWNLMQSKFDIQMDEQLWGQISFKYNQPDPEGWRKLPDLFDSWPNLLFCDAYRNANVYKLSSKADLLAILGESFHFVFYLATPELSEIAVFDDHQCLRSSIPI